MTAHLIRAQLRKHGNDDRSLIIPGLSGRFPLPGPADRLTYSTGDNMYLALMKEWCKRPSLAGEKWEEIY